jgi:hypothetical protein
VRYCTETPFFDGAEELRSRFEAAVGPAKQVSSERFVWDYWHIPDQYTYLRTPAANVVSPSLLARFMERLRTWGDEHLGCDRAMLPWLSYYVDGCRQELHSDVVQGTWSYVYSLTRWDERIFTGGETLLGAPRLLTYWESFDAGKSTESRHLLERVPAGFDQLCVFDSRLPHAVATVEGTRDPLKARVALHGWFHPPELRVDGALTLDQVATGVDELCQRVARRRAAPGARVLGQSCWRVTVNGSGAVDRVDAIVDNLVAAEPGAPPLAEVLATDEADLRTTAFPPADGPSTVRIPLG